MDDKLLKFSPVCMKEGSIWDEGGKTEIVQILISYGAYYIKSIQFVYVVDGNLLRSEIHGEFNGENSFAAVGFDYPSEYLVSVSGWHYKHGGLASIAFGTNKRTYGPFGSSDEPDNPHYNFAYDFTPKSSFGGFHGSVGIISSLSIGVYIRPVCSLVEFITNKPHDQITSSNKSKELKQ